MTSDIERVLEAGRAMATELEEYIECCGNSPPDCQGCRTCNPAREALLRWACFVAELRRTAGKGEP